MLWDTIKRLASTHPHIKHEVPSEFNQFRAEIWKSSDNYGLKPADSFFSHLRYIVASHKLQRSGYERTKGSEFELIPADLADGKHVISFGGGPDLYRLMHDFPMAKEFHFTDMLSGWWCSPAECFDEFVNRLHSISPRLKVSILDQGFTENVSEKMMADKNFYNDLIAIEKGQLTNRPMSWEVKWHSPTLGKQSKIIHYHVMNYDDPQHMKKLLERIPKNDELAGMLMVGTHFPLNESANIALRRLMAGGVLVCDSYIQLSDEQNKSEVETIKLIDECCAIENAPKGDIQQDRGFQDISEYNGTIVCTKWRDY